MEEPLSLAPHGIFMINQITSVNCVIFFLLMIRKSIKYLFYFMKTEERCLMSVEELPIRISNSPGSISQECEVGL